MPRPVKLPGGGFSTNIARGPDLRTFWLTRSHCYGITTSVSVDYIISLTVSVLEYHQYTQEDNSTYQSDS